MKRVPISPDQLRDDQRVAVIVHQNQFIQLLLLADIKLLALLNPARLPPDIARAVEEYTTAMQEMVAASSAELDCIMSDHRVPDALQ